MQISRIPESNRKLEEANRKPAMTKYLQRIRQVLRSHLNGRNIRVLLAIGYPAKVDKKAPHNAGVGLHLKSSTLWLNTKWKEGSQRLVSVRATIQDVRDRIST